jgi:hypothetical protein
MDFDQVDRIINSHGFASEPAFKDVYVSIHPIPEMDGSCPLGLYYPDTGTIVIPPDGYESVLLHELGHRFGHYHYDDLSEKFAEQFREDHQGYGSGRTIMYAGNNFAKMPRMGVLFEEGEPGAIELEFSRPLNFTDLSLLKDGLACRSCGEALPKFYSPGNDPAVVGIQFTRGVDWLTIVAASLGALTVAGVGAMGYAIYKVADSSPWVVPLVFIGGVSALMLGYAYRKTLRTGR